MKGLDLKKLVRPLVLKIAPYRSARDEFEDFEAQNIFLDANENPFENGYNRYPDPQQRKLKRKLAEIKSVNADQILLGNGSDEVLDLIFRAFCEPSQDEVMLLPPTYGMYKVLAKLNDINIQEVPLNEEFQLDIKAIKARVSTKTKIIFVCSPNNPSGNALPLNEIESLFDFFDGLVVLDEAYVDFSEQEGGLSVLNKFPRLIVCQTLSKAYGLAGIRLGMCFADATIISVLNTIKPPYNINVLTQSVAFDGLEDAPAIEQQIQLIVSERIRMATAFSTLKFVKKVFKSDANFLLIKVDDANKRYDALVKQGVVVRNRSKLHNCESALRITIGTPEENNKLISICKNLDQ